ncbi:Hypothetical predicted protein [Cloeon dipterum]|uniref:Cuticle protein 6 n=1 Tax=Cloeon dipterum TaxID=197152 RepID=A0A8S1CA38_9INSE|nr:Hypothetical predicted protein [Cloeon dipterum]
MFRHALLLVYLSGSVLSTPVFYGSVYHQPVYYYHQSPAAAYFRTPYHPYVPTPAYYQPHRVAATPVSDAVAKPFVRGNEVPLNDVSDDATVVEAAPDSAPATPVVNPKNGAHLGNVQPSQEGYSQDGFANDAPPSVLTHGPSPGSYTAVSSDEDSESTLFQSQDGSGNILFGYSSPQQARLEARSLDGSVRGSYSYVDPEGKTVKVRYSAGRDGFQVFDEDEASSVLPKQVQDTPEVVAAKSLFARLFLQAKLLAAQSDLPAATPVEVAERPEKPEEPVVPVKAEENEQYDNDEKIHPPDSIYTVSEGLKGVEEDLEYYGAAKGTKPMTYASHFHPYGAPQGEQQHLRRAAVAAAAPPQLSAYSAPSLREQQHLHRTGKSLGLRNPAPEGKFASFGGQTVPVFVGVAPPLPESEEIASTRSAALPLPEQPKQPEQKEQKEQQAIPPASISQKATFFGAVPVAAVHDTQVSPNQRVQDHQTKPVYIESN